MDIKGINMKSKQWLVAVGLGLAALTTAAYAQDSNEISWPEPNDAWLNKGTFIDVEQLRRMGPGLNKDQVRELISYPQFSEGFMNPREWNYLFNFRTGKGYEYITCQYQVQFDKNTEVESMHWREPSCGQYLSPPKPVVQQSHPITLSSDGLFEFGRSGLSDLQETGRMNLANIAGQIKSGYSNLRAITVVGHTDRIGSAASNAALSIARANTVKSYFMSQGIDGNLIQTQGVGSNKPVAFCSGAATKEVIACLMPNRRIEITVNADK